MFARPLRSELPPRMLDELVSAEVYEIVAEGAPKP
jgi:hypothetical protein